MSEITSTHPRPLVQWVSRATAPLARDISTDSPIGAVATSVRGASHMGSTLAAAVQGGAGVVIDTEAWRSQLEPDDPQRADEYRRVGLDHHERQAFSPSGRPLGPSERSELCVVHRNVQVAGGATILLTPYHRVREELPLGPGRRLDLGLAHEFSDLAEATGALHGAPGGPQRSLAVAIAVDARRLSPAMITELVAAYREVRCDLFWVWVWEFTSSAAQYLSVRELAVRLQSETTRPCLLAGIGRLWEPALRNEVAAVCQGWGRTKLPFPPPEPPEPKPGDEGDEESGWGVHVLHPAIRGTTQLGRFAEEPLRRLFSEENCLCGSHEPSQIPEGSRARHGHNCALAEELTRPLYELDPSVARAELTEILDRADGLRERFELTPLERGWRAAAEAPVFAPRPALPVDLWRRSA